MKYFILITIIFFLGCQDSSKENKESLIVDNNKIEEVVKDNNESEELAVVKDNNESEDVLIELLKFNESLLNNSIFQ